MMQKWLYLDSINDFVEAEGRIRYVILNLS